MKEQWRQDSAPGTLVTCTKSGWSDGSVFLERMKLFIDFIGEVPDGRRLVLILDGHSSHLNLDAIELARASKVVLFCLPPHTTHHLQPLDKAIYGPFKHYFALETDKFAKKFGLRVTVNDVPQLFRKAWLKTIQPENAISGFRACGICPFDPTAVDSGAFSLSERRFPIEGSEESDRGIGVDGASDTTADEAEGDPGEGPSTTGNRRSESPVEWYEDEELTRIANNVDMSIDVSAESASPPTFCTPTATPTAQEVFKEGDVTLAVMQPVPIETPSRGVINHDTLLMETFANALPAAFNTPALQQRQRPQPMGSFLKWFLFIPGCLKVYIGI